MPSAVRRPGAPMRSSQTFLIPSAPLNMQGVVPQLHMPAADGLEIE
jgi:hypothetical protein